MEQSDEGRDSPMIASRYSDGDPDDYNNHDVLNDDDQEETSKFESCAKSQSTEWTNEKHSLYLKSIESSFVDQLYSNMGFPSFQTSRKPATEPKPHLRSSVRTSAGQFKTLRGGYWQKIVGKGEVQPDGENTPFAILTNPWIRHYIHSDKHHVPSVFHGNAAALDQEINSRGKAALPHRFNMSLKISNPGPSNSHHPASADNTEASGQNFVNEDIMEEKPSCSAQSVKNQAPMNDPSNRSLTQLSHQMARLRNSQQS